MTIPTAPTTRCLRVLMGLGPFSAPSAAAMARLQEAFPPTKTLPMPPLRLPQAGGARCYGSGPKKDSQSVVKTSKGAYMTPRVKKFLRTFEAGPNQRSPPKPKGERFIAKGEKDPEYSGPRASRPGNGTEDKEERRRPAKNDARRDRKPGSTKNSRKTSTELSVWETEGALSLPHDRETLYGVAEHIIHWVEWFPGCNNVKVLSKKSISDQSGKTKVVPETVEVLFGRSSPGPVVRLHVRLQPGFRVELVYTPPKNTMKERTKQYEISWHFKDKRDSSSPEAMAPPPVVGTHVRFHFRVRSKPNVILNCEQIWGRGFDEESAGDLIGRLGERAAYLQSRGSASESDSGPNASPGLDPEEDVGMLVRRQPARSLTMRDRGNRLIRRVKADGADAFEQERLHQRFASKYYRSDP